MWWINARKASKVTRKIEMVKKLKCDQKKVGSTSNRAGARKETKKWYRTKVNPNLEQEKYSDKGMQIQASTYHRHNWSKRRRIEATNTKKKQRKYNFIHLEAIRQILSTNSTF